MGEGKFFRILGLRHNCIPIKVLCMNINWDTELYRKKFFFVPEYGEAVLELLNLKKDDRVIDLGCSTGPLTQKLADMGADVLGIDASAEMIALAKKTYPNLPFERADALEFSANPPADAVFSNAVFHWIDAKDHPLLLSRVNRALRPGGRRGSGVRIRRKGKQRRHSRSLQKDLRREGARIRMPVLFPVDRRIRPVARKGRIQSRIRLALRQAYGTSRRRRPSQLDKNVRQSPL